MLPITRVVLYTSGVGYFERRGAVEGDARLTLSFPIGQINDVLKSLVLLDEGGGAIQPVTYGAKDPVSKALQAFSIPLGDNPDRPTLLNRMRGERIAVDLNEGRPLSGVILGVESETVFVSEDHGTTQRHTLNLLTDDGLHAVPLAEVRRIEIQDAALAEEFRQALAVVAAGRDATKRPLTLAFSGEGIRPALVGYLAESPAWQTSYRLILGDRPRLQGWALAQNTSQDDWTDVRLTLVSGRPISFIQDLYTPLYVHRPTVAPKILASPTPQSYASGLAEAATEIDSCLSDSVPPPAGAAPAPKLVGVANVRQRKAEAFGESISQAAEQSVEATGAQLGASLFAYEIDQPVSIPRQQSALLPFLSAEAQAERVSVYNPQVQPDHPLSGVRFQNTTGLQLMGGPLTVFDTAGEAAGYVGDALIEDTEPGQTRLMTYAVDLSVDAAMTRQGVVSRRSVIRLAEGTLRLDVRNVQTTVYTFKNHSATPRQVIIERPRSTHWALIEPPTPDESTATHDRILLAVPAGESASLRVIEEHIMRQAIRAGSLSAEHLLEYAASEQISPAVQKALTEIAARRREIAERESKVGDIQARIEAITAGQDRIRKNMQNLEYKSDLYKRYLGELDTQETMLKALEAETNTQTERLRHLEKTLQDYVAGLILE